MAWRCFLVRKQLALLVGDDLAAGQKQSAKAHLDVCPSCRQHFAALERSRAVILQCQAEHPPIGPSLWPRLQSRLAHAEVSQPVQSAWLPLGALAAACVAMPPQKVKGIRETVISYEVPWQPIAPPMSVNGVNTLTDPVALPGAGRAGTS